VRSTFSACMLVIDDNDVTNRGSGRQRGMTYRLPTSIACPTVLCCLSKASSTLSSDKLASWIRSVVPFPARTRLSHGCVSPEKLQYHIDVRVIVHARTHAKLIVNRATRTRGSSHLGVGKQYQNMAPDVRQQQSPPKPFLWSFSNH
jgi:hypothetical protein